MKKYKNNNQAYIYKEENGENKQFKTIIEVSKMVKQNMYIIYDCIEGRDKLCKIIQYLCLIMSQKCKDN